MTALQEVLRRLGTNPIRPLGDVQLIRVREYADTVCERNFDPGWLVAPLLTTYLGRQSEVDQLIKASEPRSDRLGRARPRLGSRWLNWLTYAIAAGALTYVLVNVRFSDLAQGVSQMRWWPIVLAVLLQIAPRVVQAWRWGYLLRPVKVRLRLLLHAIYVSTLMNGVLPVCPSDLVRGVMVARRTQTGTARVFTSQAVERVADGIALVLMTWLAMRGLHVPAALDRALLALLALVALGIVIGIVLMVRHQRFHAYATGREPAGRMGKKLKAVSLEVLAGVRAVKAWTMPVSISTGIGIVAMQIVTMWLMLYAYRMDLSLIHAAALFGIITIGTLIPNAPGKVGAWQFFCILGLELLGVPATQAASFSIVAFAVWTLPSLLLGALAMVLSPVSWADIRGGRRLEAETQPT